MAIGARWWFCAGGEGVAVVAGAGVGVAEGVDVAVGVGVGVAEGVVSGVAVGTGVAVGVAVGVIESDLGPDGDAARAFPAGPTRAQAKATATAMLRGTTVRPRRRRWARDFHKSITKTPQAYSYVDPLVTTVCSGRERGCTPSEAQ
jgi:hypothetical protein